jgi:conjugal transfer/entry exclusion protein
MPDNNVKFSILVKEQFSGVMNKARNSIKSAATAAKEMEKQQRTFSVNFKDHYSLYNKYQSDLASGKVKREWARTVDELKAANLQIKNAQKGLKRMESLPPDSFLHRLSKATLPHL